jgi:hypothetical protein
VARHENALLFLVGAGEGFTLAPFWLGYAIALAICVGWAWRLSRDAAKRDQETYDREEARLDDLTKKRRENTWRTMSREWSDRERGA